LGIFARTHSSAATVQNAGVAGVGVGVTMKVGQVEEAEDIEPVSHRHEHDVVLFAEVAAIVAGGAARACRESAAVKPHHDGPLAGVPTDCGSIHVEVQAVLVKRTGLQHVRLFFHRRPEPLRAHWTLLGCFADIAPSLRRLCLQPAVGAFCRRAIGHAFEYFDRPVGVASNFAVGGVRHWALDRHRGLRSQHLLTH
jgi:hypothetical protein